MTKKKDKIMHLKMSKYTSWIEEKFITEIEKSLGQDIKNTVYKSP